MFSFPNIKSKKDGLHLGKWSPSEENMRDVGHFNKKNIEEFK